MPNIGRFARISATAKRYRKWAHNCTCDFYFPKNVLDNTDQPNPWNAPVDLTSDGGFSDTPDIEGLNAFISFNPSTQASPPTFNPFSRTSTQANIAQQQVRLIMDEDYVIPLGTKIIVNMYKWRTGEYTRTEYFSGSGAPRVGQTGQIIFLRNDDYIG